MASCPAIITCSANPTRQPEPGHRLAPGHVHDPLQPSAPPCGHLLQGRFKAHLIDADAYARQLVRRSPEARAAAGPSKPVPGNRRAFFESVPVARSSQRAYAGTGRGRRGCPWSGFRTGRKSRAAEHRPQRSGNTAVTSPADRSADRQPAEGVSRWAGARRRPAVEEGANARQGAPGMTGTDCVGCGAGPRGPDAGRRAFGRRGRPAASTWMRVVLGGERMSEVARELGYSDASGVFRVIARLRRSPATGLSASSGAPRA